MAARSGEVRIRREAAGWAGGSATREVRSPRRPRAGPPRPGTRLPRRARRFSRLSSTVVQILLEADVGLAERWLVEFYDFTSDLPAADGEVLAEFGDVHER